ncbi:MAG TPA: hypothetical protein VK689_14505, partial [Armatimonadota bacterium]|nr:hypothetical protein [Armatimonadota bacterium]
VRPAGGQKGGNLREWLATHEKNGKTARFRIRLAMVDEPKGDLPIAFTRGTFLPETGSESTALLADLATALGASSTHEPAAKKTKLEFTAAILGRHQSKGAGKDIQAGGFTSEPPGPWIVTKVFLNDGESEVYLNIDLEHGVGEFAVKDTEYGDGVLKELARVL